MIKKNACNYFFLRHIALFHQPNPLPVPNMLTTIWKRHYPRTFSYYLNIKIADYLSRRSYNLASVRRNRPLAIFANDYIGIHINQFGLFEHEELGDLFEYLSPIHSEFRDGMALDVGANIGNHSLFFSDYFLTVHAYEPSPRTFELLKINTTLIPNIEVHPIGLGNVKGEFELTHDVLNPGLSSMKSDNSVNAASIKVHVEKLDGLWLSHAPKICLIKIDVEGFEANVLSGGYKIISQCQPLIILEQHESEFSNGSSPSIGLLSELGYKFSWKYKRKPSKYWIVRRLVEAWEILSGRDCRYVTAANVPTANYDLLVAIPQRLHEKLGVL